MMQAPFAYLAVSQNCSVPPDMSTLPDRIREARQKAKLSQSEMARRIGVTSQAVNMWERSKSRPLQENLVAISNLTNVSLDWLITGSQLSGSAAAVNLAALRSGGRAIPMVALDAAVAGVDVRGDDPVLYTVFPCGPNSYAVVLNSDSNAPSHPKGSVMVLDPDRPAEPGNMVFAVFNGEAVFGRLSKSATAQGIITEVRPLKDGWPSYRSDHGDLIVRAVMTESILRG